MGDKKTERMGKKDDQKKKSGFLFWNHEGRHFVPKKSEERIESKRVHRTENASLYFVDRCTLSLL
jgi:hypothetical protein